jgi:hypothetical protein
MKPPRMIGHEAGSGTEQPEASSNASNSHAVNLWSRPSARIERIGHPLCRGSHRRSAGTPKAGSSPDGTRNLLVFRRLLPEPLGVQGSNAPGDIRRRRLAPHRWSIHRRFPDALERCLQPLSINRCILEHLPASSSLVVDIYGRRVVCKCPFVDSGGGCAGFDLSSGVNAWPARVRGVRRRRR